MEGNSPDLTEIQAGQKSAAGHVVDEQLGGYDAGNKSQEAQNGEQTLEQKINALVDQVREVNSQLGGKVAAEVSSEGRSTFFFARTVVNDSSAGRVYGVDSISGPIYVSGALSKKLLLSPSLVDFAQASKVTDEEVKNWTHIIRGDEMNSWGKSFEDSKNEVLQDQMEMQRVREARSKSLDQAMSIVSKPIDISATSIPAEVSKPSFDSDGGFDRTTPKSVESPPNLGGRPTPGP